MSSAALVAMASEPAAEGPKRLHPLFASLKANEIQQTEIDVAAEDGTVGSLDVEMEDSLVESVESTSVAGDKKRKPDGGDGVGTAQGGRRRGRPAKKRKPSPAVMGIESHFLRQSANEGPTVETVDGVSAAAMAALAVTTPTTTLSNGVPASSPVTDSAPAIAATSDGGQGAPTSKRPVRVLQFNPKTGTIGSPPRPKASKAALVVHYGQDDNDARMRIGTKIDDVMLGKTRMFPPPKQEGPKKRGRPPKKATPTHPFFTGGLPKAPSEASSTSASTTSAATRPPPTAMVSAGKFYSSMPCSPKRRRPFAQVLSSSGASGFRMPQFGINNGILRVPGACLPAWPWQGTSHVRPPASPAEAAATNARLSPALPLRKRKGQTVQIDAGESVLDLAMQSLHLGDVVDELQHVNSEELPAMARGLRLPQKHLLSGRKVQGLVDPQLQTGRGAGRQAVPKEVGVDNLFGTLATTLSAFDQHQCEVQSWTQKYAPTCAAEVLQSGREPQILRDWLAALKVVSVDTGEGGAEKGEKERGTAGGKGKKRKKNKLDGFVVSDGEDDELGEGGGDGKDGNSADWTASGLHGLVRQTVVRTGGAGRLVNAIVLSGPHGCGKTAAVYAAARELEFEVFEINASSRRSGKDVMDRIGDMTRNHLVQHRRGEETAADGEGDSKQTTMRSFFQAGRTKAASKASGSTTDGSSTPSGSGGQMPKQSLILLEEADILYEEDRQFWTTVMSLMAQSKRPFVITCNDERLLPLATLQLHGMLRLRAAPKLAAVDRLLVIAACEGHLLQRRAVEALYEARGHDLRAALAELQFWCQLGVGDRRGGFEWFVQRWPEGMDRDEEQQVVRVVSEGTYLEGMGWVGGDDAAGEEEEELILQTWENWQVDVGEWPMEQVSRHLCSLKLDLDEKRAAVDDWAAYADTMSDADVVTHRMLTQGTAVPLDPTQPLLPARARDDFVVGQQLLEQPDEVRDAGDELQLRATTVLRCGAKKSLVASHLGLENVSDMRPVDVPQVVAAIRRQANQPRGLCRIDFALAFDPIAVAMSPFGDPPPSAAHLDPSVFDRNLEPIAVDVAPIVRGIVAHDGRRMRQRLRLTRYDTLRNVALARDRSLRRERHRERQRERERKRLEELGVEPDAEAEVEVDAGTDAGAEAPAEASPPPRPKRMRTTRTSLSALEGIARSEARRDSWFLADINPMLVAQTAGHIGWSSAASLELSRQAEAAKAAEAAEVAETAEAEAEVPEGPSEAEVSTVSTETPMVVGSAMSTETSTVGPWREHDIVLSSPGREES